MDNPTPLSGQLIDDVLGQRPFAAAPPDFTNRVMARIQATQLQPSRMIRFRLEPLDVALPLLAACLVVLVLGLTGRFAFLNMTAPISWSAVLDTATLTLPTAWLSSHWPILVGVFVFAEITLGVLFCMWMWLDQPLTLARQEA